MANLHGTTSGLRAQRSPPLVTIFGTAALAPLCQGAAGGLPVPAEARQVARGATAEPGCTFKGPVAAGARLHSCSGAAAVPTRRARQPARQPARPARPAARTAGTKPAPAAAKLPWGAAAAWALRALRWAEPAGRGSASPRPALRPAGALRRL